MDASSTQPALTVADVFLVHGPLGAIALLALWWAWRKDRQSREDSRAREALLKETMDARDGLHREYSDKLVEQSQGHNQEILALEARYRETAKTWITKHNETARAGFALVEAHQQLESKRIADTRQRDLVDRMERLLRQLERPPPSS